MARLPAAWLPCGVVEWHSHHLPLGTDGLKVERLCSQLAQRLGGLVFPAYYLGSGLLQYPFGLSCDWQLLHAMWVDLFRQLDRLGFRYILVVSGHYSGEQLILLAEAAESHMADCDSLVLATREAGPVADSSLYFDHAARYETSLMMALEPSLVDMSSISSSLPPSAFDEPRGWREWGIMGVDPRSASREQGLEILGEIMAAWEHALRELQSPTAREYLANYYEMQRKFLAGVLPYYAEYFRSGSHGYQSWDHAWDSYYARLLGPKDLEQRSRWFRTLWKG